MISRNFIHIHIRNFIVKNEENFSEHNAKNFTLKFLTVPKKKRNDFCRL